MRTTLDVARHGHDARREAALRNNSAKAAHHHLLLLYGKGKEGTKIYSVKSSPYIRYRSSGGDLESEEYFQSRPLQALLPAVSCE